MWELLGAIEGKINWGQITQIVVSLVGFVFVIFQLAMVRRALRGSTHDRIYAHYNDVCKTLLGYPELYSYFYENADPAKLTREDRRKVRMLCEIIMGLIEHAVVQRSNMPPRSWSGCWRPYALERIKQSQALREYFDPNQVWYTEAMRREYASMLKDLGIEAPERPAVS
jgi:hypothetical protein